jgi:hypothetical protein
MLRAVRRRGASCAAAAAAAAAAASAATVTAVRPCATATATAATTAAACCLRVHAASSMAVAVAAHSKVCHGVVHSRLQRRRVRIAGMLLHAERAHLAQQLQPLQRGEWATAEVGQGPRLVCVAWGVTARGRCCEFTTARRDTRGGSWEMRARVRANTHATNAPWQRDRRCARQTGRSTQGLRTCAANDVLDGAELPPCQVAAQVVLDGVAGRACCQPAAARG